MNELLENEFVRLMEQRCFTGDKEADHDSADDLLVELLRELGYTRLADLYEEVGKYYA